MDAKQLKNILEAGLLVAGRALSVAQLEALFQHDTDKPDRKSIKAAMEELKKEYEGRGIELVEVASGYRLQSHASVSDWVGNLFQEKTPRYSRALLETLVLIAYRQPITRAEIEDVRGVAVSSNIIKTLQERNWVKVLGHKEVPGKPALLGTTKEFLDYFNLAKLDELPDLAEIKDLDQFDELLAEEVGEVGEQGEAANDDESADNEANPSNDNVDDGSAADSSDDAVNGHLVEGVEAADGELGVEGEVDQADDVEATDEDQQQLADDGDNPAHSETLSGAEIDLMRVITEFSEEHQQELDARDQMEAGIVSKNTDTDAPVASDSIEEVEAVETVIEEADLSQRIGDDQQPGPAPGDTLH